ncbi:PRC-barrel domain containing protein [Halomonas sp. C05BenzN]|uniref:PRC-barrel domain containing protein n=1 Tax=Halomonas sp. C05BenzN TaxID=3411041 RepID=UPI003B95B512
MTTRHLMTRTLLPASLGLLMAGLALAQPAAEGPQGLYSARAILDADVHLDTAPDTRVGRVDDILLGDDMAVHALVVQSGATLGLGGREVVVTNALYRLDSWADEDGTTRHRVMVEASEEEFAALPHYDRDWWQQARERSRQAWQDTQEGADSAWQRTRRGAERVGESAERAWERTREGAERAGQAISDALEEMSR